MDAVWEDALARRLLSDGVQVLGQVIEQTAKTGRVAPRLLIETGAAAVEK